LRFLLKGVAANIFHPHSCFAPRQGGRIGGGEDFFSVRGGMGALGLGVEPARLGGKSHTRRPLFLTSGDPLRPSWLEISFDTAQQEAKTAWYVVLCAGGPGLNFTLQILWAPSPHGTAELPAKLFGRPGTFPKTRLKYAG
jgi:hypothetical protein